MTIRNQRFSLLKQPIYSTLNQHLIDYPTPSNLSYWWGFGSLAGICLVIQIVTGVFLAMHHTPHVDLAFNSVEHIMRDVEGGWLLRYMHANGASMFLIVVHLHIFRGLYHASYSSPREFVRCLGVVIFLLMIVTAFIGYVPPWGQMSFWGATVITSLASAIPVVGDTIVTWLWGGFSVDNATLNRFFSLHHLLALVLPFDLNVLPPGAAEFWQGQPPFPDHENVVESDDSSTDSSGSSSDDSSTDSSDLDTDYDELTDDSSTDSSGSSSDDMDCSEGTPPPEGNESRLIIFL